MLSTCEICRRRDYCDNCALADDCYWIKAIPPRGGDAYRASRLSAVITRIAEKSRPKIGY